MGELPSAVDLAWAAGLFAGEGYCGAIPRGKHKYLSLQVQMLAAMWPYLVGTAKGDQIRAAAEEVGVFGWIDGSATEERPARLNGNQWSDKTHTPETKAKMAAARRAYWARRRGELP